MAKQTFDLTPYPSRHLGAPAQPYADAAASLIPQQTYSYSVDPDHEDTLLDYWRILWKHKTAIALLAVGCGLVGLIVSLAIPPVYQAHTSLEIERLNSNFLNAGEVRPTEAPAPTAMDAYIHGQAEMLRDEYLISRVVSKLNMASRPEFQSKSGLLGWLGRTVRIPALAPDPPQDRALKAALQNLKVQTAGDSPMVKVLYDSTDPRLAADFVNTLAGEYIDQTFRVRWETSERMRDWLTRQKEAMRGKLERDENALQTYAQASGLLYTQEKSTVNEDRLRQLEDELAKATSDRVAKQSQYEMADASRPEWLPQTLSDGPLRDYQVKLTELRRQQAELSAVLTPTNYKVQRVQAQISEVETALNRELASAQKRIYNEFKASQTREQLLASAYARQVRLVSNESSKSIRYQTLRREAETTRALYDALAHRVEEASLAAAAPANNIRVTALATAPTHPYKPNLLVNSAIGLFTGFLIAVGLVILRERGDRSLKSPGEATSLLGVPEIGIIPAAGVDPGLVPFWRHLGLQGKATGHTVELVTSRRKNSALSEAFRETVASRLFNSPAGAKARVIVLSSPGPIEGKTTIVSNLGIALAQIQRRVLLVEGDLRRSRLHEIFGLENTAGLSDLLTQDDDLRSRPLDSLVQKTDTPHLFLLPAGSRTTEVPNILYSDRLGELLDRFRGEFDTVLIDAPPTLYLPDARVLGRLADGVVLVLRAGKTNREAASSAARRLAVDGIRVLGTILNDWNPKSGDTDYAAYNRSAVYYSSASRG